MATLSELVDTVAAVEGLDSATVSLIARNVREAGLIATGGRGPSAARMGLTDAANLLIAVNATKHATEAVRGVTLYGRMELHESGLKSGMTKYPRPLEPTIMFREAIEQLIHAAAIDNLPSPFLGTMVPEYLQERFSKGNIHIALTFNTSFLAARLRIAAPTSESSITHHANESVGALLSFDFLPSIRRRSPRARERFGDRVTYSTFRDVVGDRIEKTTIGYRTIHAVGKLIFKNDPAGET
ncbi:MAG: hypothetical protein ACLPTZ_06855 [Beijerinckiaceae bacterium]|jgi:hypothetical protein